MIHALIMPIAVAIFIAGMLCGHHMAEPRGTDGYLDLRSINGKPTIVISQTSSIADIVEKGYACFEVRKDLLELDVDDSRDI